MSAPPTDHKQVLHHYLRQHRDVLAWKLEGLDERAARLPMTPTGTNLLGIVKHVASVQLGYLGEVFDRPSGIPLPWFDDDAEPNADMWATTEESREDVLELHRRSAAHADATIAALPLDAVGHVPWWDEDVTLQLVLVHLVAEVARHAGHADVVRELLDGGRGVRAGTSNLPEQDEGWWERYRERLQRTADGFGTSGGASSGAPAADGP